MQFRSIITSKVLVADFILHIESEVDGQGILTLI